MQITTIDDVKALCKQLEAQYSDRNATYTAIEDMYFVRDNDLPSDTDITKVISPDARNKVNGMIRLLTATEPKWSIPTDRNDQDNLEVASKIERAATAMWVQAGRVRGRPIEKDVVLSAGLYSMVSIVVKLTKDIITVSSGDPIARRRAEKAYARTPLLFTALPASSCYPLFDDLGLVAHYFKRDISVADIRSRHGEQAAGALASQKDDTKLITYHEYWDWQWHAVWVDAGTILFAEHKLPVIPVACKIIEGSPLFATKDSIQPFLYGLNASGIWKAQNKSLTAMFSNTFNVATSPMSVFIPGDDQHQPPVVDYSTRGGMVIAGRGDAILPFQRQAIDPALQQTYDIARNAVEESTIYSQTLGQPLGGNAPYSMVALLSEAGRLPLVPYQEMCSELIGEAMQIGMLMLREVGGGSVKVPKYGSKGRAPGVEEFDPKEYQDDMELQATLDISMPQDERGNVQVAMTATQGGLLSKAAAMEKYLNIGQPDDMTKQILAEKYYDALAEIKLQQFVQQQQQMQQQQQAQQQGPPQGMPPEMGGQMPGGMSPDQMMMQGGQPPADLMQQQAAQEGLPMTEPIQPGGEQVPPEFANIMGGG